MALLKITYDIRTFRGDLFGGLTSAVVGLPVSLAFGVASGLGAIAGIYGAIAVGFFAAVFGGTRSQISGPTGPMAVAMAVVVTSHAGSLAEAFTVVVMAGLMQMLLGVLRIGRFVAYTPYSVISGFMSGIGIIIILLQTLPFLGAPGAEGGPLGAIRAWPDAIRSVNLNAVTIAAVTLAVGVLWPNRLKRFLPATLAALIAGTSLGVLWLTNTPVIGDVPTGPADAAGVESLPGRAGARRAARVDYRPPRLHRQLAHLLDSRLDDPYAPRPEPRAGGAGASGTRLRDSLGVCPGPAPPWVRWSTSAPVDARAFRGSCALGFCWLWCWVWGSTWRRFPTRSWRASY